MAYFKSMKEIKTEIQKATKKMDQDDLSLAVKVFETDESGDKEYYVEVFLYEDGEMIDSYPNELHETLDEAMKKAKARLKTVKNWMENVEGKIEVYHI